MKKNLITVIFALLLLPATASFAQDIEKSLNEAKAAYSSGRLEEARFALQQAMNEIDLALAREILKLLPASMANLPFTDEDETAGSAAIGFASLFVSRTYRAAETPSVNLQIIADSPMLAGINAILALPVIGRGDPNSKRVRLGSYRGLLNRSQNEDGAVSWDLQIPFGSSLLTMSVKGINEENKVMEMANSIAVDKIARLLQ